MRQEGKLAILKGIEMRPIYSKENRLYSFVPLLLLNGIGLISISFKMANFPFWRIFEILKKSVSPL